MASDAAGEGPRAKVFISYSRKDMTFADRLDAALKQRQFEPLIDRSEIYAFEDWWARIQSLIAAADTVIFVLSPDSVASPVCAKEVAFAASLNKRFAPVVVRRVDTQVPEPLARLNFIFFDEEPKFDESFDRLCEALGTDIDWIRRHTEFGEAGRRWAEAGRSAGLLLRSPALEEAESWIAARPAAAPLPTEATQAFILESRRAASRRRNVLTGSLAAGLILALALAGLAFWQRGIAVRERQRAETTLALATKTANGLVFDLAQKFRNAKGVPANLVKDSIGPAACRSN
ncbi:MAG TPA: toll/interleukin-1 receptor domain-containing protein [Methylovirgula sp.]|nr:toll/interleukin-1 receptor domain-containing protein [Methylovirgula sp.]